MIVWAVADRALDIIGLGTLIYWTVKLTKKFVAPRKTGVPKPRAERL